MHALRVPQDGPADNPGGSRASGGVGSSAGAAVGGGSGDADEAAEPLDTLSDVESDEAEEDKQCAMLAGGVCTQMRAHLQHEQQWSVDS